MFSDKKRGVTGTVLTGKNNQFLKSVGGYLIEKGLISVWWSFKEVTYGST